MKTKLLLSLAIFFTFSGFSFAQNVIEMYPKFGLPLEFNPKNEAQWDKAAKIMRDINWDHSELTAKQKLFFKQIGYGYEDEDGLMFYDEIWEGSYYSSAPIGCSWYCGGGPDSISASSYLKSNHSTINYLPQNAHDFSYETGWVEGAEGYGIGEYIVYHFRQDAPRITRIIIANGYVKSEKAYRENSRVKRLKLYIDNKPFAILNLEDSRHEQVFEFEPIGQKRPLDIDWDELDELPKWTLKFEILDIYQGEKYDDVAISEIYFDGIDVHCFAGGTKILMADNSLKNIELIQKGDIVKSYDFENKKFTNSTVTTLVSATHCSLLKLKLADNEIVTTADHPFWTDKNVWAAIDAPKANKYYFHEAEIEILKIGDKIFMPEKNVFAEIIDIESVNVKQNTYTIELAESDNFIANGMLVKTEIVK